ncbi:hypothetical protein [Bacillus horti]|uniref:Elongation factor G-binding protein N-terminal domain-containing protein n=1 Tax=Caldalkalibacillus horti TaxID=77523 RepID=A0ABT9VYB5_9BACI|nr:hypothetical protein [Bacillus horti]MDQ0165959.1 hypothetical protein [Bacillus horti]
MEPFLRNDQYNYIKYQTKILINGHATINDRLLGLQGSFNPQYRKEYCTICHKLEEVGMFMIETKRSIDGSFTRKGNLICQNSQTCNHNIMGLDKLETFIQLKD